MSEILEYFGTNTVAPLSEKPVCFSDMASRSLPTLILGRIANGPARAVWTANDFADLGLRNGIDKALQRLAGSQDLRRIDRGLYDRPTFNTLTWQSSPPDPRAVIDALVRRDHIRVLVDGMTAANDLGLIDAVPAKILVHTEAPRKTIRLGKLDIVFRPSAASKLYWAGRPAMRIVQALTWLRDTTSRPGELHAVQARLRSILAHDLNGAELRADLRDGLPAMPSWMQDLLKPLIEP